MKKVVRSHVKDFCLEHIFECGQAFRFEPQADGSYTGIAGGNIANLRFDVDEPGGCEGTLTLSNVSEREYETFWKGYLDLERDYGAIKAYLSGHDPVIRRAIAAGEGIRILRQDKWETLLSFIISQNNNIPRIKKCIEALCREFGSLAGEYEGRAYYAFPEPETLAALEPEDLANCRLGYRAKYLVETARKVARDGRERLEWTGNPACSPREAFEYVTEFCGVGPKVANCILLFSMGRYDSFPVDVWVKKVMKELYGLESPKEIGAFAQKTFGRYGGFAQQYLFYYIREREKQSLSQKTAAPEAE